VVPVVIVVPVVFMIAVRVVIAVLLVVLMFALERHFFGLPLFSEATVRACNARHRKKGAPVTHRRQWCQP
jgi:hypothetical protein